MFIMNSITPNQSNPPKWSGKPYNSTNYKPNQTYNSAIPFTV